MNKQKNKKLKRKSKAYPLHIVTVVTRLEECEFYIIRNIAVSNIFFQELYLIYFRKTIIFILLI